MRGPYADADDLRLRCLGLDPAAIPLDAARLLLGDRVALFGLLAEIVAFCRSFGGKPTSPLAVLRDYGIAEKTEAETRSPLDDIAHALGL